MGGDDKKRKQRQKPYNRSTPNLDFSIATAATTTATPNASSSNSMEEDIVLPSIHVANPSSASPIDAVRRGRSRKSHEKTDKPGKTLVASPPARRAEKKGSSVVVHSLVSVDTQMDEDDSWEEDDVAMARARAVPSMDAVVKVFCTHTAPNFSLPWQRKRQASSTSSGFVISGRRVLTNAHSVEHYTQVKLKKRGSDTKYVATVLAIGTECDIAMLTVDNDEFWEGLSPVQFGDLPALQDAVTVVGYPIGGDTISVTSGVVSRIEILSYVHGSTELLGLQIDAAINSGNSGGPALNDKSNCVGIAFQSLKEDDVENIGYVIPTPVIMHFIQDYEKNGAYTGFPILAVELQKMENSDMRKSMGMKHGQKGVRIRRLDPTAPGSEVLKPSDIILCFDGVNIANDGTVPFRLGERISFSYLVSQKYSGDVARIKVLRNSETLEFSTKLMSHRRLIPAHCNGKLPSYYIIAGLVFTNVTVPYLHSEYTQEFELQAPVQLLDKLLHGMPKSVDEQLVVISQVLVADINIGYEDIVNKQVVSFNDKPLKNLKSLVTMVEGCNDEFLKFDLEFEKIVVLRTKSAKAATADILATHGIDSAMSFDLKLETETME